ncbi:hypothetical protein CLOM_g9907, partial [Closterium sp. NIES-68]
GSCENTSSMLIYGNAISTNASWNTSVILLGNNGLKVDPKKVVAVQNWPVPQDVGQIRSFLGLANYFCQFLENYSTLTNAPVLVLPDPSKPYEVVTDASTIGIGAVLLQEGRPVAFESRKLSPAEQRYTTSEQELLAVVHALRTWRCYLEGVEFVVTTDHCPNTYFSTQATLTRRQARWQNSLVGSHSIFDIVQVLRTWPTPSADSR